jgi:DNA-binding response OmpR family regulator
MRANQSDPLPDSFMSQSTNFPIVPMEEIPASGSLVDTSEYRPVILVVDDEAAVTDSLVATLQRSGYAAIAAYDGASALETALVVPPELVIAEAELPGMNGVELAITLSSKFPDCKVLLLAGQESKSDLQATLKGHEFEMLSKPVEPSDLFARVSARLKPGTAKSAGSAS